VEKERHGDGRKLTAATKMGSEEMRSGGPEMVKEVHDDDDDDDEMRRR